MHSTPRAPRDTAVPESGQPVLKIEPSKTPTGRMRYEMSTKREESLPAKSQPMSLIPLKREQTPLKGLRRKLSKVSHKAPLDEKFSAVSSLSSFLETRGHNSNDSQSSQYFAGASTAKIRQERSPQSCSHSADVQVPASPVPLDLRAHALPHPLQAGPPSQTIILSSSLLESHRGLVRYFEALRAFTVIYRDFSVRPGICNHEDADIIASPTTAVVLTTLQATTQIPLPGHKSARLLIRDRIAELSSQFDNLVVLVTYTSPTSGMTALSAADAAAFNSIAIFCATFDTKITPLLLPTAIHTSDIVRNVSGQQASNTDDSFIERWVRSVLSKYAWTPYAGAAASLMQDETQWELFLRRMGMNAFAAQAVLGALKEPHGVHDTAVGGLRAAVKMSYEERTARFAKIVGARMVGRISRQIDASWVV